MHKSYNVKQIIHYYHHLHGYIFTPTLNKYSLLFENLDRFCYDFAGEVQSRSRIKSGMTGAGSGITARGVSGYFSWQ